MTQPRTAAGRDYCGCDILAHDIEPASHNADCASIALIEAEAADGSHPRTYSLTASGPNGDLFLVTDDESGITIGHAKVIGGPLTAPTQRAEAAAPLRAALEALDDEWLRWDDGADQDGYAIPPERSFKVPPPVKHFIEQARAALAQPEREGLE